MLKSFMKQRRNFVTCLYPVDSAQNKSARPAEIWEVDDIGGFGETRDVRMASELRAGLKKGVCGGVAVWRSDSGVVAQIDMCKCVT